MSHEPSAPPSGDEWERVRKPRSTASWNLSVVAGEVAILLAFAVVVTYALGKQDYVRDKLAPVLPHPVLKLLGQPADAREKFGLGDTKEHVLATQGKPSMIKGNVWNYGDSKVFFVEDHVVGWKAVPGSPLKTR